MKIKTSTNLWCHVPEYGKYTDEECIEILKNAGYEAVDFPLCDWPGGDNVVFSKEFEKKVVTFAEKLQENGMTVGQTHLPYYPSHYPPIGDGSYEAFSKEFMPLIERTLELTAKMGCKVAVIHLYIGENAEETLAFNKKYIDSIRPICRRTGVKVAIESIFGWKEGKGIIPCNIGTAEELLTYVEYGGADCFGVCIDTGHAALLGDDPVKLIEACGEHLIALHINGNLGRKWVDDLHLVPGSLNWSEQIKWEKISEALGSIDYSGTYNLEVLVPYGSTKNIVKAFINYTGAVARHYADMI